MYFICCVTNITVFCCILFKIILLYFTNISILFHWYSKVKLLLTSVAQYFLKGREEKKKKKGRFFFSMKISHFSHILIFLVMDHDSSPVFCSKRESKHHFLLLTSSPLNVPLRCNALCHCLALCSFCFHGCL